MKRIILEWKFNPFWRSEKSNKFICIESEKGWHESEKNCCIPNRYFVMGFQLNILPYEWRIYQKPSAFAIEPNVVNWKKNDLILDANFMRFDAMWFCKWLTWYHGLRVGNRRAVMGEIGVNMLKRKVTVNESYSKQNPELSYSILF